MVDFLGSVLSFLWPAAVFLFIGVVLALPLALFTNMRGLVGLAMFIASIGLGLATWLWGLAVTWTLWGGWAAAIGLFFFGVGTVPMALVAAGSAGQWETVWHMLATIAVLFGSRWFGRWLADNAD